MSRRLRFIPEGGALVEVTCRTVHGRFLLRPGAELNEIVVGILGRAQRTWEVKVCAFAFLSNHYHLLLWVKDAQQLGGFMNLFNSKLAREVRGLTGWKEKIWSRRYQAPEAWRARVADLVAEIEATAAVERSQTGVQPPGPAAILKQRFEDRPNQPKKSCAPFFHAASRRVRKALYEAYALFVSAYREASEKLQSGDRTAVFPAGSFPPALPFVPTKGS